MDRVIQNSTRDYGICMPPCEPQFALNILIEHFLGDGWCISMPVSQEQVNTEAVYEILSRYTNTKIDRKSFK